MYPEKMKEYLRIDDNIPKTKIFRNKITPRYQRFLEVCDECNFFLDEVDLAECHISDAVTAILNDLSAPKCNCGKVTTFNISSTGTIYSSSCEIACRSNDKRYTKKISNTKTALYEDEKWKEGVEAKKVATCKKNNGVDYPMQNVEIFEKQQSACFEKDENGLHGFEPHVFPFLKQLYPSLCLGTEYLKKNDLKIKWFDDTGKYHYSYPDFYSYEINTFVEIKSDFTHREHFYKIMKCKDSLYEMRYGYITCIVTPKKKFEFTLYNHEYIEDN
jgi:hypothetical protein